MPWKIVYNESFTTKSEAMQRERFLKKQRNHDFYKRLINENKD
jgi:putative endonuclease